MTIGYIPDFPNASVLAIAEDQKLWEAEGVTPSIKVFTNGPIQIQAMGAGSLNFGTIGPGALWLPASGKAKVIGVNDIGFSDRVIAQPGIKTIAAISLAINYPTLASVTHSLVNSYKNLLAVALATEITFEGAERAKEYLANPEAFAAAAPAAAAAAPAAAAEEAKEEKKEEAEESDDDMGFGLFD